MADPKDKKAYIDEVEFNRRVIASGVDDPTQDSPEDSDADVLQEIEMGLDSVSEDEPDEIVGRTEHRDAHPTAPEEERLP